MEGSSGQTVTTASIRVRHLGELLKPNSPRSRSPPRRLKMAASMSASTSSWYGGHVPRRTSSHLYRLQGRPRQVAATSSGRVPSRWRTGKRRRRLRGRGGRGGEIGEEVGKETKRRRGREKGVSGGKSFCLFPPSPAAHCTRKRSLAFIMHHRPVSLRLGQRGRGLLGALVVEGEG